MKSKILSILLCFVLALAVATTYHITLVSADSGFDVDYDGGGSWDSDRDYSSSHSNSGTYKGVESPDPIPLGLVAVSCLYISAYLLSAKLIYKEKKVPFYFKISNLTLFLIIVYLLFKFKYAFGCFWIYLFGKIGIGILKEGVISKIGVQVNPLSKEKQEELISNGLDINKLIDDSFEIYKELQIAWMNFDYDKIKELVNDEMYNMYINQLETLKLKDEQNIMADIKFEDGYIVNYNKSNKKETVKIYLTVNCRDYIIKTIDNKVVRGDKDKRLSISYVLTFERNLEAVDKCPECGAYVKDLTECEYCGSKIVNNNSNMKLVKKEIKKQSRR